MRKVLCDGDSEERRISKVAWKFVARGK